MRLKGRKRSEKQTLEEIQTLKGMFNPQEIEQIIQLVSDLHRIRKIEKNTVIPSWKFWQKRKEINRQIEMVAEQQYFFLGDFIIRMGIRNDKDKIKALWKYLQSQFS